MTFSSLESLKKYLIKDSKELAINPVRFVSVDSLAMWIEVKKMLLGLADESISLSSYCEDKDTTPNLRRLTSALKKVNHSVLVMPLSEHLRIKPEEAEETVKKIIKVDYQNNDNGQLRIYFLMYRIKSVLKTISTDDPRTKDCLVYLETNEESDYKLTIVQKALQVNLPGNEIFGYKSYLEYWEANPDKPLILHTDNAIHFEKNHFFDDVRVIVSSYDLIKERYGLPAEITEILGTDNEWNQLAKQIVIDGSFAMACCSILAINKYNVSLFERWNQYSAFQRWVLWLWTRLQMPQLYVTNCAKSCRMVDEFIESIYCKITEYVNSPYYLSVYNERKKILMAIASPPTEKFWGAISNLPNKFALACLTDVTDIERKTIFDVIANVPFSNRFDILGVLKTVYPKLYWYLYNDKRPNSAQLTDEHYQYFEEYKWLKVTDTITESFLHRVQMIAEQKGESVFAIPTRNSVITSNYTNDSVILFVDGMGIEYVDYLAHLFEELDSSKFSFNINAGYCTLPSITEINKDFLANRNTSEPPIRDLDELKHSNNVHPDSIIKQFSLLDGVRDRILGLFAGNINRVIVAADHGTSRLAVKVRGTEHDNALPKPEGVAVYKYGRFCEDQVEESSYPTSISINGKLIFADYSRFIQNGAPIDEIHGGASLEEWIVPIVVVDKVGAKKKEVIVIKPEKEKYKPELGTKLIRVGFTISGNLRKMVSVSIKGQKISCEYADGWYRFVYKVNPNETRLTIKVLDGGIIGDFDIEIEQGIQGNAKFDI